MKRAPVRHAVEYGLYLALRTGVRALPHEWSRPLGGVIGRIAWLLDARHRRVARRNLSIAFADRSDAEHRRIVRDCFRHWGSALADALSSTRFDAVEYCRRTTIEGWEHVDRAEALGRGAFIMSAHFADWEATGPAIGLYRGGMGLISRPADNPWLDRELNRLRERFGNHTIEKRGAARPMLRLLQAGRKIGMIADQRVPVREGIAVPFFGRLAWTTPVVGRMSLRTGAPIVPVFGFALPGGRYRVVFHPPIIPPERYDAGDAERWAVDITRRYLELVEREIRAHPPLWLWLHDRWRDAPDAAATDAVDARGTGAL